MYLVCSFLLEHLKSKCLQKNKEEQQKPFSFRRNRISHRDNSVLAALIYRFVLILNNIIIKKNVTVLLVQ